MKEERKERKRREEEENKNGNKDEMEGEIKKIPEREDGKQSHMERRQGRECMKSEGISKTLT